uniref:Protein kinase domain-containing protein n=1 Tax=Oryza rufipogon TaxID=4529 RepID=A0A0E0QKT7_ORYRU
MESAESHRSWRRRRSDRDAVGAQPAGARHGTSARFDSPADGIYAAAARFNVRNRDSAPFLAAIPLILSYNIALPGCTDTCGNTTIPYPFGIGDERCFREGFKLVCDPAYDPPKLFMNGPGYEVHKIKLARRVLHLDTGITQMLGGDSYNQKWILDLDDKLFRFLAAMPLILSYNIALPGCTDTCGNTTIPYPFGIGDDRCFREGFKLVCDPAYDPPKLFMNGPGYEVHKIKLARRVLHLDTSITQMLGGDSYNQKRILDLDDKLFRVSADMNVFITLGCAAGDNATSSSNCVSNCRPGYPILATDGTCYGIGCCNASVVEDHNSYTIKLLSLQSSPRAVPFNASMVVVKGEWWRRADNAMLLQQEQEVLSRLGAIAGAPDAARNVGVRTVVNWMLGNSSCVEAKKLSDFGCLSDNSECFDGPAGRGYACKCRSGYDGNPYMPNGCQDINECMLPNPPLCFGKCINTVGSYECICPGGTSGNAHIQNGCVSSKLKFSGLIIGIGLGGSLIIVVLILAGIVVRRKFKSRRAKKLKEFFFKQNRGLLLHQLVDKDIAERMIFSLEELEKATNNFDESRKLGGGGHGTVYKGILSDQCVVAIKKSRYAIKREIDGFINEVAILSQVNHRNVVKLFGCCLETEVPLLVYEFIPNGTLHEHLHVNSAQSVPWKERLRIALEIARDIKTTNILLDDRFIAKVSDFGASRGIPIDQNIVTTTIQGTFGYLDPEYYRKSRLTEKSDVYSFGVILAELITRRRPTSYISPEGFNLTEQFILLVSEDRLLEIVDSQITKEQGEEEAREVAEIAVMCLNLKGEDRPTMRQVEVKLEGLQGAVNTIRGRRAVQLNSPLTEESDSNIVAVGDAGYHNSSRRLNMEEEFWRQCYWQQQLRSNCRPGYPILATDGTCYGIGCCNASVVEDHNSYTIRLLSLQSSPRAVPFNASMVVVKGEWWRRADNAMLLQQEGTFGYLDPEYYRKSRLTEKSDVYSFGVILAELITRRRPTSYISPEGFNLTEQFILLV